MSVTISEGGTMITGEHIPLYRLLTLKAGIKMEMYGMKLARGRSCYAIVKSEFGFKGSKEKVLAQLEAHIAGWSERAATTPQRIV